MIPCFFSYSFIPVVLLSRTVSAATAADSWKSSTNSSLLKDNSPNCSCYAIESGSSNRTAYFLYHRFYDFRALASSADQFTEAPDSVAEDEDEGLEETPDQLVLNSTLWNTDWAIQNWGKNASEDSPVRMQNSPQNVYIMQTNASDTSYNGTDYPTYLTLRTVRLDDFQSAAELENEQKNLMHASLRMRARVVGDAGAVAGFFTYYDDDNESDIEILTDDPTGVYHYTNQPSVQDGDTVPAASHLVSSLPARTAWHTHRLDWLPAQSVWYLDAALAAASNYSVPRRPSGFVLNVWSDGGEWSGNMSVGGSAELQVEWVQVLFNVSGPAGGPGTGEEERRRRRRRRRKRWWWERGVEGVVGKRGEEEEGCEVVCKIDGVERVGFPEVAASEGAGLVPAIRGWVLLGFAGFVSLMVGL